MENYPPGLENDPLAPYNQPEDAEEIDEEVEEEIIDEEPYE